MAAVPETSRSSATRSRRRGVAPSSPSRSSSSRSSATRSSAPAIQRRDIGFTCAGSCDYLSGQTFSFVMNLEAVGAWPPISESHVEMDGAWALYEAWVRLQHGDVDTALAFGSGKSSPGVPAEIYPLQMDPYTSTPLGIDPVSIAALQARAMLDRDQITEREMAEIAARSRRVGEGQPVRAGAAATSTSTRCWPSRTSPRPLPQARPPAHLRRRDRGRARDGGEKAKEVCEHPVWIRGIDHRIEIHQPGHARPHGVAVDAHRRRARRRRRRARSTWPSSRPRSRTRRRSCARRSGSATTCEINPSGGALAANPMMAVGLIRFAEAARQIAEHGKHRAVAHATSGQCLQQNLVCVLEGD